MTFSTTPVKIVSLTLFFMISFVLNAVEKSQVDAVILDIFPDSVVKISAKKKGTTVMTDKYKPSGSPWYPGLDESNVFNFEIIQRSLSVLHSSGICSSFQSKLSRLA